MITKVYRYQLAPNSWDRFLEVQKKADALYSKHVSYEISFVRSEENPLQITEIHRYPDLASAKKTASLHSLEPELTVLFEAFTGLLDPAHSQIEEVIGETFRVSN